MPLEHVATAPKDLTLVGRAIFSSAQLFINWARKGLKNTFPVSFDPMPRSTVLFYGRFLLHSGTAFPCLHEALASLSSFLCLRCVLFIFVL